MESIGEKLKTARERNNLTIEQVARETHVARRFLKALEDEDFAVFPGETYAMGFLRNYAEYLGLNPDELVGIYRNIQIQEQPLPMNELLDQRPKAPPTRLLIIGGGIILVLALAGYIVYRAVARGEASAGAPTGTSADFVLSDDSSTQWFSQGDGISVPVNGKNYRVVVANVDTSLTLKVPGGTVDLGLGKERYIDLSGDSTPDLRVVWNDVDRSSTVKRVNLGLYRVSGPAAAAGGTAADAVPPAAPDAASAPPVRAPDFPAVTLATAPQQGLFVLDFTFANDCLFRYAVDGGQREADRFFQKGEQFSVDTGRKQVIIWISNAGAARMRVQGKDFALGALGEVATRKVAWRTDAGAGTNVLELTALY